MNNEIKDWVLVPREPTPEMIEAGILFGTSPNEAAIIFQSMANTAPTPPAEAQAQGGGERVRLAMPDHIGLYQGPDDCPHLQLNGVSVAVFPAGSWSEVCDALDSITGSTAPPSAPVGVEELAAQHGFESVPLDGEPQWEFSHSGLLAFAAALAQQPAAVDEDVGNTLRGVKWAIPALNNIARRIRYVCPNVSEEVGRVAATLVTGIIDEGQPQGADHD